MARYFGKVGYGESVEKREGVWEDQIVERSYYGDVIRNTRRLVEGGDVLSDVTTNNQISIVADPYALSHFHAIRYVEWSGVLWVVSTVDVQNPRLILSLGVRYNGPEPSASADPETTGIGQPTSGDIGW